MAKSKSGGTRSYIRGKVGADVYSIGKDGAGKKQQVVRSLAETVANPQTESQMRGRMIMSTVMQAVSAMSPIIDHSFDGIPVGQPSISEFIRRNYALVKADVEANPSGGNSFGLNKYQEKGIKRGEYLVSAGKAVVPSQIAQSMGDVSWDITLSEGATVADLKLFFKDSNSFYCTLLGISASAEFIFVRLRLASDLDDATVVSNENVSSLFNVETNGSLTWSFTNNSIRIVPKTALNKQILTSGVIVSVKANDAWEHNECRLVNDQYVRPAYTADVALPTYPLGSQRFLNGGEI